VAVAVAVVGDGHGICKEKPMKKLGTRNGGLPLVGSCTSRAESSAQLGLLGINQREREREIMEKEKRDQGFFFFSGDFMKPAGRRFSLSLSPSPLACAPFFPYNNNNT
jgi:hypothetical protein